MAGHAAALTGCWEAMRPELLQDSVVKPEEFVQEIEDTVVCHCDQVLVWLRVAGLRQLYRAQREDTYGEH